MQLLKSFSFLFLFIIFLNHCGGSSNIDLNQNCEASGDCVITQPPVVGENPPPVMDPNPESACSPEICDGLDNDCDQVIDEDLEFCENGQSLIPPDPVELAPEVDSTVTTTVYSATEFLYTGANAVQTGMDPATIEPKRVAVIRGRVLDVQGEALPGVKITIKDHPEYGQTLSRLDGWFDMVINGGRQWTVVYEREGYLSSMRYTKTTWQDYFILEDVVLLELDSQVSVIDLSSAEIEVASGSLQSDADGERQATLLFKPGTTAEAILPDGSTQALESLSLHATEFTVGENGPQAMPAPLPATSAYTYAVSLDVEEALALGAGHVEFNQAVPFYVENFLGFPTGLKVPLGVLDKQKGA
ncbi:MAG: putative metal-binding motif-containing protein, partial [Deltaproteobacteria bacterium]|nr:putative metal-binding motif-containing protein [Deltaproteobacteria bacterium]